MDKVTDIRRARDARESRLADERDPDLILEAWLDHEGQIIASCLKGTRRVPTDTEQQKGDLAQTCMGLARQGAVILSEIEGGWQAQPVMHAMLTRGGFYVTQPNQFWREEAEAKGGLRHRARCAWWVMRQLWGMVKPVTLNCLRLVLRPSSLRGLEVE